VDKDCRLVPQQYEDDKIRWTTTIELESVLSLEVGKVESSSTRSTDGSLWPKFLVLISTREGRGEDAGSETTTLNRIGGTKGA
jgi:hypothetical protein